MMKISSNKIKYERDQMKLNLEEIKLKFDNQTNPVSLLFFINY